MNENNGKLGSELLYRDGDEARIEIVGRRRPWSFDGEPIEFSGNRLQSMRDEGKITLNPATFETVYKNDTRYHVQKEID